MKKLMIGLIALAAAAPAFAQKIQIEYAHGFDFDGVKTFSYVETPDTAIKGNQLMADRVVAMIRQELVEGGLTEVKNDPDIFVTYHFIAKERKGFTTSGFGYGGYWDGWYGWGAPMMTGSVTREYNYTEGTLVIDAYDSAEKKMVWRGSGTVTVKEKPEKQVRQVEKILAKLGNRWDRILAGKGK